MADEELGTGSVRITLDDSTADADANRLGDRIERVLDRASRDAGIRMERNIKAAIRRITPIKLRVEADLRAFEHSLNTLNNLGSAPVRVVPDVDRAQFEAAIEAALAGLEVSVRVVPDLDGFDAAIRAHNTPTVTVDVEPDVDRFGRAMAGLGRIAAGAGRGIASALKLGAVGIAAAGAVQGVLALGAALAPLAGALAAGPAVILGYVAASGALKLALNGVGDAFKAGLTGDAAAFEKSLKGLAPAAQAAAREVRALKPQFDALKTSVQSGFFSQFEGQITKAAAALGGPLKKGLTGIAEEYGKAANEALKFAQTKEAVTGIQSVLGGTKSALSGLSTATQPVLKGFLDVAAAISDAFGSKVGTALGDAAARFGTFLSTAAASGQAVAWVKGAAETFSQLGEIIGNVGGILSNVFGAANDVGGGLLNNLAQITGEFEKFTASVQGQEAIGNIFAALSQAAAQLGPILSALVTQLGAIAPAIGPLFATIGPAITGIISAIGPAIQNILPGIQTLVSALADGIGQISDSGAFEALGTAIGSIATAIAPLLPVVGQLVGALVSSLAPAVTAIAQALTPVIEAIANAFTPIIPPLTDAISTLVTALTPLVTLIGQTLAQVIQAVAPLLGTLASVFTQIVTAVTPLIEQITAALMPIFAQLAPIITQIVTAITPLIEALVSALLPILPPIIDAFLAIVNALTPLLPLVGQLVAALAPLLVQLVQIIAPVIQFAAEIIKWTAINVVVPIISAVVSVITSIVDAVTTVLTTVSGWVGSVISFFSNLKSNVTSIVSGLISSVVGFFAGLPGKARAAVSSIVSGLTGVFNSAKTAVVNAVTTLVSNAVTLVKGLPGKAKAALSNLASTLVSAGKDLIRGFINGIKSVAGEVASAAKNVAKGAVNGVKNFLGINSPSKVFIQIGKFVGDGFVKGLQGSESDIKQAAEQVIGKIREAFKGKNTRLDDQLIKQVQQTQKKLLGLAKQRDDIAKKIQQANEFAATVTQNALSAFSLQNLAKNGGGIQGLTDGIDSAVARITKFNQQINSLAKKGLRKDLLQQIIGLGPEQGAELANTLNNATSAQLEDLNNAQKQLAAASKKLGKDSADNLFDAGKQASKGFLAGLKAQQKDVEDLMLTLARAMAKSIRKALGIKSPSRVFRKIGQYTMDGLSIGVDDRLKSVGRSALNASRAVTEPFGASPGLTASVSPNGVQTATGGRSAAASAGSRSQVNNITINEVGDGRVTAARLMQRLALSGGGL